MHVKFNLGVLVISKGYLIFKCLKSQIFPRDQLLEINFVRNLPFQHSNGLAQEIHEGHMVRTERISWTSWASPLERWKGRLCLEFIFKSWFLGKFWLYHNNDKIKTLFIGGEVIVKAPPCGDSGKAEQFLHQSTPMVVFGKWQRRRKPTGTFIISKSFNLN